MTAVSDAETRGETRSRRCTSYWKSWLGGCVLHLDHALQIEDPRTHPAEVVAALRDLLAGGANATPDPKRASFYEVENASRVFYIHISPVTGNVLLLATWPAENSSGEPPSRSLAAA